MSPSPASFVFFILIDFSSPQGVLQYFIHAKSISWAKVFQDLLEFSNNHEGSIDSFSIQETTLEDIFQQFRNEQMGQ